MGDQHFGPLFTPMETTPLIHGGTSLGGLQKPSIRFCVEGNILPLLGLDNNILEPVTFSLYILSFPGSYYKLALK